MGRTELLAEILEQLDRIEAERMAETARAADLAARGEALGRAIVATIKTIRPGVIYAEYGDNRPTTPGARLAGPLTFIVRAIYRPTLGRLAEWGIFLEGRVEPPAITQEDVLAAILAALEKIKIAGAVVATT